MVCWYGTKCACPLILDKDLAMNRKLALMVIAFGFACAGPTLAFDADHLAKVKAGEDCIDCDLSGADLTLVDLSGADLSGADLSNSSLPSADLSGANLSGANLHNANLTSVDLSGARMLGAILCNTIVSDGSIIYSGC
jgi:uncharacterized protein YjbI with pentapeptide repeats